MGSRRCGLIDRVGQGGNLGDGLGGGKSLIGGVGKVASQSVVLNGVMSWGTDKVGAALPTTAPAGATVTVQARAKVTREEENRKMRDWLVEGRASLMLSR